MWRDEESLVGCDSRTVGLSESVAKGARLCLDWQARLARRVGLLPEMRKVQGKTMKTLLDFSLRPFGWIVNVQVKVGMSRGVHHFAIGVSWDRSRIR